MSKRTELAKAIGVTAELTQTELSTDALRMMVADLERYPEQWIAGALTRCRRELKGRLTLADILARMDDGRPGAEEAWAMLPKDEAVTAVWTEEMRDAFAIASPLLDEGDTIAARMAFKEAYLAGIQRAREGAMPPLWSATLGHDPHGRERILLDAVQRGRLATGYVAALLPYRDQPSEQVKALLDLRQPALEHVA